MSVDLDFISEVTGASIIWPDGIKSKLSITGIGTVQNAQSGQLTFASNPEYFCHIATTQASAIILKVERADCKIPQLIVKNPYAAFARAAQIFAPKRQESGLISSKSTLAADLKLGQGVTIYPNCYVAEGVQLGARVTLYPGVYIGARVSIGDDSVIYPNSVILDGSIIGQRVCIHAGTVIGADGFGFAVGDGEIIKVPQVGIVVIEDDVELGASCTVDRAAIGETRIGRGTKFDSKVHIGHNATIGSHCLFAAHTAVAGSARVGNWVMAGGHSGIAGHLDVGSNVQIGAMTGVIKDAEAGETYLGFPALPAKEWRRQQVYFKRLPDYDRRIRMLEKRLEQLSQQSEKTSSHGPEESQD